MEKEPLTNEKIRTKFLSQFELVRYAIRLAENMIRTGRAPHVKTDLDNPAMQVLAEIHSGKDRFEDSQEFIPEYVEEAVIEVRHSHNHKEPAFAHSSKSGERKKSRIIH